MGARGIEAIKSWLCMQAGDLLHDCTGYCGPFHPQPNLFSANGIMRVSLGNGLDQEGVWVGRNGQVFTKFPSEKATRRREIDDFLAYASVGSPVRSMESTVWIWCSRWRRRIVPTAHASRGVSVL